MDDFNVKKRIIESSGLYIHKKGVFNLYSTVSGKSNNSDITQENFQAHLGGDIEN